jgi:hypothetical protein
MSSENKFKHNKVFAHKKQKQNKKIKITEDAHDQVRMRYKTIICGFFRRKILAASDEHYSTV